MVPMTAPLTFFMIIFANEKQLNVNASSAGGVVFSSLGCLTVRKSKKYLRARRPFIRDDGVKRSNVHSENKFVTVQDIEIAKNLKCVLTVLNV